jgi:lipid II:glycine glycyltransferase (peptidoglycan interpeptide bridge formation enzyme)
MLDIWRERFSERRIEVPLLSDSYLKELVAAFPQDVTVYNLSIDGRLAAATACCVMQKERYCYWIGNVSARKDLSVNDYLMWEVIQQAKSEGFKKLDLGGATKRLSRFKSKFDPVLEPYCIVERRDMLRKIGDFANKTLNEAKMLALHSLRRAHL